ncbi:MAG: hypothetical protein Udaeo_11240 [Candidatus Udaeobacter sp.]|nr:MAG: hypothetical protein Udaeo_11240 [Candidatus Udaeobacter sp.]
MLQSPVVVFVHPVDALAEREVAFRKIRLQSKRSFRFSAGFRSPTVGRFIVTENFSTNGCEPRVSEGEIRIEFDCLHVKLLSGLIILQQRVGIAGNLIRAEIENVRIGVLRRLRCCLGFLIIAKRCAKRIGNFAGQFSLQTERINQSAVVTIGPNLAIISRID